MPILELTQEAIGPDRTRLVLAYLEALMLWPHDPAQQEEVIKSGVAAYFNGASQVDPTLYALALDAIPIRLLSEQSKEVYLHGVMAGELLATAVNDFAATGYVKLEAIKTRMLQDRRRRQAHPAFRLSRSWFEEVVWKRYKPVAHLWGAHLRLTMLGGNKGFPCELGRLPEFLGLANFYLEQAKKVSLLRRNEPLLLADFAWGFPAGLELPRYEFIRVD